MDPGQETEMRDVRLKV